MSSFIVQLFIIVALIPVWFMLRNGRSNTEPKASLGLMVVFGVLAVFITYLLSLPADILLPETGNLINGNMANSARPDNLMLGVVIFATIEELAKFLPAALFLYPKKYFNQRSDGVLYFAVIGLSFGLVEDLLYLSSDGAITGLIRIIFGWFFHGALTGIIGYTLATKKVTGHSWLFVAAGIAAAIVLHSVYNYSLFASTWNALWIFLAVIITVYVNASLFILFFLASRQDAKALAVYDGNVGTDF